MAVDESFFTEYMRETESLRPDAKDVARDGNNNRKVRDMMPIELADSLLYGMSELMELLEKNGGELPVELDTLWSFAWHVLMRYRDPEMGLLPTMERQPEIWRDFTEYITEHYMRSKG